VFALPRVVDLFTGLEERIHEPQQRPIRREEKARMKQLASFNCQHRKRNCRAVVNTVDLIRCDGTEMKKWRDEMLT
jgi:hypothetical protein